MVSVAQLVERWIVVPVVLGSFPGRYPHHIAICDGLLSHANSIILSWMLVLERGVLKDLERTHLRDAYRVFC